MNLYDIFLFSQEKPLIFTRLYFWFFFAFVLIVYSLVYKKRALRNAFLFFASLFFYYKTSGFFFSLLLLNICANYFIGASIFKARGPSLKKGLLFISVAVNLSILSYFKYAYFFTDAFNQVFQAQIAKEEIINHFAWFFNELFIWVGGLFNQEPKTYFTFSKIILPVGISFFTFQTMTYTIDIYRGKLKPLKSFPDFGFYVSFFPQLVAGPIVRASEFAPQMYKDFQLTRREFGLAVFWILNGLVKKIFIADYIAVNFVDRVFENPLYYSGFENLMALYGYSLQVYADFSGYTDIAIGLSLLMGFRLQANFNSPYKARNVGDFWKRWHISLSTFLRDYLYIPMGGNRRASWFTYTAPALFLIFLCVWSQWFWAPFISLGIAAVFALFMGYSQKFKQAVTTDLNLMITMLLGGLWHGASWQFVIWGGLNGLGLLVYKFWLRLRPWQARPNRISTFWKIFITFNFITFTRIFFRSGTMETANNLMCQIGNDFQTSLIWEALVGYKTIFLVMLFGYVVHWLPESFKEKYRGWFIGAPLGLQVAMIVITIFIVYQSISADAQPFIYFQF